MKAEELRELAERDDHDRGCEGRCYTCGCGYDARVEKVLLEAARTIEALEQRGAEAVIAYHAAICAPKGVVPVDSLYDPALAADMQARLDSVRAHLLSSDKGE